MVMLVDMAVLITDIWVLMEMECYVLRDMVLADLVDIQDMAMDVADMVVMVIMDGVDMDVVDMEVTNVVVMDGGVKIFLSNDILTSFFNAIPYLVVYFLYVSQTGE